MLPQRIDPDPGRGAGGKQRCALQPVGVEQLTQVLQAVVQIHRADPVHLVQHNHYHLAVPGKWPQIAVMHRRIRVFLGVQHPDELIDDGHHPIHLGAVGGHHGIVIWQVQQHHPSETIPTRRHRLSMPHTQPVKKLGVGFPKTESECFGRGGAQRPRL